VQFLLSLILTQFWDLSAQSCHSLKVNLPIQQQLTPVVIRSNSVQFSSVQCDLKLQRTKTWYHLTGDEGRIIWPCNILQYKNPNPVFILHGWVRV
jgi:hypothetical protein